MSEVTAADVFREVLKIRDMAHTLYYLGWGVIVLLLVVFGMQVYKIALHRRTFDLIVAQDKMVRENLGIQTNINTAIVEIAKGYDRVLKGHVKQAEQIVKDGVVAQAEVAATLAAGQPPSGTKLGVVGTPGSGSHKVVTVPQPPPPP